VSRPGTILALDTAGTACSAALWRRDDIVAERYEPMRRGQSERLLPMIAEVMAEAGVGYADVDAIGVTRGPGAFTGVRIGLATARALGLASAKPVIAATCFEVSLEAVPSAMWDSHGPKGLILVALDAKRADLYAQVFDAGGVPRSEPQALLPELLPDLVAQAAPTSVEGAVIVAGDAETIALEALWAAGLPARGVAAETGAPAVPSAAGLVRLLARRELPAAETAPPRPLYLRPPDVTLPG
jgi:tRNA threonylcarbamoyladenosine biosynthesis protein TsaB